MGKVIRNGQVTIDSDDRFDGHIVVRGARCWCGKGLVVAPKHLNKPHKPNDPVVVCVNMAHSEFRFSELKEDLQEKVDDANNK